MILFIIRHGDPVYTPDSLTQKGRLQAEGRWMLDGGIVDMDRRHDPHGSICLCQLSAYLPSGQGVG